MSKECKVVFLPSGKTVNVPRGESLLAAARLASIPVESLCGGQGTCGKCIVTVCEGQIKLNEPYCDGCDSMARPYVRACRAEVLSDLTVELPPGSLSVDIPAAPPGILAHRVDEPLSSISALALQPPSERDNSADLERLGAALRKCHGASSFSPAPGFLRDLPESLRKWHWKTRAVLTGPQTSRELIALLPPEGPAGHWGLAVDLGTTTVSSALVDMETGQISRIATILNPQLTYGADVISRIIHASRPGGLEELQAVIREGVNRLIASLCAACGAEEESIYSVMVSGNTTMLHLLYGADPAYLRREPYVPAATSFPTLKAGELGISVHRHAILAAVPGVSSYVGGDITAGIIASAMHRDSAVCLLMDLGTNGEVALGNSEWLLSASCSAGPAFEGGGISCGMRAATGAIEKAEFRRSSQRFSFSVYGGGQPMGICGSGLIDIAAGLFRHGIIDRAGRFRKDDSLVASCTGDGGKAYPLISRRQGAARSLSISEADLENLIRSKGALYSGASVLLGKMGLSFADVELFYIGGGFGSFLNIENAVTIGLLPDIPRERFVFLGNSSLGGAIAMLVSGTARREAEEVARRMTTIELSLDPDFMNGYTASLFLPHTDESLFPGVLESLKRIATKEL
ncbi:MAG: ASKHA domain-containing protein [Candidatus Eremiobacteraeota bacterium]|nr:ASKHA domain-containing protein [Candidatus Eremiobacteraeota bacterium]